MARFTGSFFERLPPDLLALLGRTGSTRSFGAGEALFYEEDPADQFLAITEGQVRLWRTSPRGAAMTVHLLGPGDLPGVAAVIHGTPFPATATAVTPVRTLGWPADRAQAMIEAHPMLAASVLRVVTRRKHEMLQRLHEVSTQPVEQRVARAVLRLVREPGGATILLTRQDLAELTATTLHTVSRIVSRWEGEGLVSCGRRRIRVLDAAGLARRAEGGRD